MTDYNTRNVVDLKPLFVSVMKGSLLLYVHVRQSLVDCALVPLVLFCHKLTVPYTVCPLQCSSYSLRYCHKHTHTHTRSHWHKQPQPQACGWSNSKCALCQTEPFPWQNRANFSNIGLISMFFFPICDIWFSCCLSSRAILQRVGVLLLPPSLQTEEDAERDSLFSPVMTSVSATVLLFKCNQGLNRKAIFKGHLMINFYYNLFIFTSIHY